ncbi:MAG TPA: hypothetical protein PKW35_12355 [Nannocystaceae bacterium]|nr:hypothetical protein [Nannocystaceae bacterium]
MSIERPDIDRSVPPFGGDRTPANAPWPILRAVLLRFSTLVFAFAALLPPAGPARAQSADASSVDFARDIRPIFDAHCVECHGPSKQKASLRLDRKKAALKGGESGPVLVPGKVAESSLLRRVTTTDTAEAMPG